MKAKCNMGICSICGQYKELTYEHIPPKQALNNSKATVYTGEALLKKLNGENPRFTIQQQGMGKYSLCRECNNNTGAWYAPIYNHMTHAIASGMIKHAPLEHGDALGFTIKAFQPLAFVKQIITMFCSTIPLEQVKRLGFDTYLLEKENNSVNRDLFDLRMYLTNEKCGSFYTGLCAPLYLDSKTNATDFYLVAELGAYPFGFILNLTPEKPINYGVSLNELLNTEYAAEYEIKWKIPYLEKYSDEFPLPLQFKNTSPGKSSE